MPHRTLPAILFFALAIVSCNVARADNLDELRQSNQLQLLSHLLEDRDATFTINECPIGFESVNLVDHKQLEKALRLAVRVAHTRREAEVVRLFYFRPSDRAAVQSVLDQFGNDKHIFISDRLERPAVFYRTSADSSPVFARMLKAMEALVIFYVKVKQRDMAIATMQEVITICHDQGADNLTPALNEAEGDIYRIFGDNQKAERAYDKALQAEQLMYDSDDARIGRTLRRLSNCAFDDQRSGDGKRYLERAERMGAGTSNQRPGSAREVKYAGLDALKKIADDVINDKRIDSAEGKAEAENMKSLLLSQLPKGAADADLDQYLRDQQMQHETAIERQSKKKLSDMIAAREKEYRTVCELIDKMLLTELADRAVRTESMVRAQEMAVRENDTQRIRATEQAEVNSIEARSRAVTNTSYMSRYNGTFGH